MGGQRLGYLCEICNLFEISVHFLIGAYGKHDSCGYSNRVIDIFVGYLTRHLQHRYDAQLAGFLTGFAYPHIAVAVFLDVAPLKRLNIAECKAGEAAEHECVPDKFQTRHHGEVKFENLHNLSLSQKLAFRLSAVELPADERVFC